MTKLLNGLQMSFAYGYPHHDMSDDEYKTNVKGITVIFSELHTKSLDRTISNEDFQKLCLEAIRMLYDGFASGLLNDLVNKRFITRWVLNGCVDLINFDTDFVRNDSGRAIVTSYAEKALKYLAKPPKELNGKKLL
jgi:hypothetical protein